MIRNGGGRSFDFADSRYRVVAGDGRRMKGLKMIDANTLIDRMMGKFDGSPIQTQERRRQLHATAKESLAKLAAEFKRIFPTVDPYDIGMPARKAPLSPLASTGGRDG